MIINVTNLLALMLGILYTVRKLDAQRYAAEEHPHVQPKVFDEWKRSLVAPLSLAVWACFLYVLLDFAVRYAAHRGIIEGLAINVAGGGLFFAWVAAVVYAHIRAHRARLEGVSLDIKGHAPRPPRDDDAERE